jgi:hypothetical protein
VREPGGEDPVGAQLTPMLMRVNVVRIVRPRAVILEVAHVLAFFEAARGEVDTARRVARRHAEHAVEIGAREPPPAARVANLRFGRNRDSLRVDSDGMHVDDVVAESVIDQRADELGAGGSWGKSGGSTSS